MKKQLITTQSLWPELVSANIWSLADFFMLDVYT
jgi:hypothetical protein